MHPSTAWQTEKIAKLAAAGAGVFVLKSLWNQLTDYDLTGKTVLITGGSRGLGLVMAREFAREGARLVLCARDEAELQRARTDLGGEVMTVPCDVTNRPSVMEMGVRAMRILRASISLSMHGSVLVMRCRC